MPRWASRITLAVEAVRVERLHDVTRDDAMAEGIPQMHGEACSIGLIEPRGGGPRNGPNSRDIWDNSTSVENYARLWDSINGKRAPWASNPWVWVVTFSRMENVRWLERGIDQIEGRLLWEAENNTAKARKR